MQEGTFRTAVDQIGQRRSSSLTSIVRDAIEDMIISGELAAGDRINESVLAARFNVSRGPIREACRGLERAGLIHNVVNQGAYVRRMSLDEARALYEVRGALAALTGELLVEHASDACIADLHTLVARMQQMAAKHDVDNYYALNLRFHHMLVHQTGNPALETTYQDIVKQLHLFRRRGLVQSGNLDVSHAEHVQIIEALQKRDSAAAARAMREHVRSGWLRMSASL